MDIDVKKERYKVVFDELRLDDVEKMEEFICAYSYFISNTNKNYKYNLTYLQSYFEDFIKIKKKMLEKEKVVSIIQQILEGEKYSEPVLGVKVIVDQFWVLLKAIEDSKQEDVRKRYTGEIDCQKLSAAECVLEVQANVKDYGIINITRKIENNSSRAEKEIKEVFKELKLLVMKRK